MAARLTDKQKKLIIADYVELGSYNAVAKRHGIAHQTVKRIVGDCTEITKKVQDKKEQNSADILAHMETKRDTVNQIIDAYLTRLLDPEVIKKATPSQLTTALGTLIDKFTMQGVAVAGTQKEEDALSKALREEARRMEDGYKTDEPV